MEGTSSMGWTIEPISWRYDHNEGIALLALKFTEMMYAWHGARI